MNVSIRKIELMRSQINGYKLHYYSLYIYQDPHPINMTSKTSYMNAMQHTVNLKFWLDN